MALSWATPEDDIKNIANPLSGGEAATPTAQGAYNQISSGAGNTWGHVGGGDAKTNAQTASNAAMQTSTDNEQSDESAVTQSAAKQGLAYHQSLSDLIKKYEQSGQDATTAYQNATNAYTQQTGQNTSFYDQGQENALSASQAATSKYNAQLDQTKQDLTGQASNSKAAYTNTVLPALQNVLDQRQGNAGSAMTLAQAEDPNNAVASGVRDMYNTQAQGIQNQGLADYGVLAALGSQATARTTGSGVPMTGGQLQSIQGANMSQAGGAFANAQNNANTLKTQGIQAGMNQSNAMYGAGQQAISDSAGAAGDYANANNTMNSIQNQYTGQESAINQGQYGNNENLSNQMAQTGQNVYNAGQNQANIGMQGAQNIYGSTMSQASNNYNMDSGLAGQFYGVQQAQDNARLQQTAQKYGTQQAMTIGNTMANNASNTATGQAVGTGVGTAIGAYFGGAQGAGAGAAAGSSAGSAYGQSQNQAVPANNAQQPVTYGGASYQPTNPYGGGRAYS